MADPVIKIKRSSVQGKIPTPSQLPIGEVALNTYDGKFYASKNVGIGTTVFVVNPWTVGTGTNTYNTYFTDGSVGIGTINPQNPLHISGPSGTLLRIDGGAAGTGTRDIIITEFDTAAYGGIIRYDSVADRFTIGTLENSVVQYALNIARTSGNVGVGYSALNSTVKLAVAGTTLINTNTSTGTSSQPLQVSGGAYVSGNLGVGVTNPTSKLDVAGDLKVSGVSTFQSNVFLGDNDKIILGSGFDLEIFHDGSNSYIFDNGTGSLKLTTQGTAVDIIKNNGENLARFLTDGAVELYYDNSKKFETTSDGITVTGTTDTDQLIVSGVSTFSSTVSIGTTIDIVPYDSLGTLSFEGSAGQLFSITNNLTSGSIFSVNDVSGIPSIDVDADGTILLSPYGSSTEYVGIGTTNPTQTLHVQGNARLTGALYDALNSAGTSGQVLQSVGTGVSWVTSSAGLTISNDTSTNATRYVIFDDVTSGSVSAANVSSTKLTFNPSTGTLSATVFTSLSDETKKTDITQIENALDIVKEIRGVKYKLIDDNQQSVGVIAQEVEKVLPEVVNTDENGLKSVSYGNIVGVLIEAIKEQQEQINILKDKISELEK